MRQLDDGIGDTLVLAFKHYRARKGGRYLNGSSLARIIGRYSATVG